VWYVRDKFFPTRWSGLHRCFEARSCESGVRCACAVVLLALLTATPVAAGNISLSITAHPELRDETLAVKLTVRNGGDEAARSVSPTLHFRDGTARADVRPVLGPGETYQSTLTLRTGELRTGRYPYRIAVDYADANEYPFQALHAGMVIVGAPPPPKVAVVEARSDGVATTGSLQLRLKNLSATARTVDVAVYLPEGVELEAPLSPVELAGWEERKVAAPLVNRTALPGSRYGVFVSAEYDDGDVHHGVVTATTLEIVAEQSVFERKRTLLWGAAGLLVLAWAAAIGWRLAARRRTPPRG
jgi:hypothetical protein